MPPRHTQLLNYLLRMTRHIQQKSALQAPHYIWLQPWFFSIFSPHFGQGFVKACIHLIFSESACSFSRQFLTSAHDAGVWSSFPHLRQVTCPQVQRSIGEVYEQTCSRYRLHPLAEHETSDLLWSVKCLQCHWRYFLRPDWDLSSSASRTLSQVLWVTLTGQWFC